MVNDKKMLKMAFSHVFTSVDKTPAKIRKIDKDFVKELDFNNMMFPVKIRDIHKFEKKMVWSLVFLVTKMRRNIQSIYQKQF